MLVDEILHITHDLRIAFMGIGRDLDQLVAVLLVDSRRLRVQHERNGKQTLCIVRKDIFYVARCILNVAFPGGSRILRIQVKR